MRKKERIREIQQLKKTITEDRESFRMDLRKQEYFFEDLFENLARQQYPGTTCCEQCDGVGKKQEDRWYALGIPAPSHGWTCDKCEGTGRVPIEEKKGRLC